MKRASRGHRDANEQAIVDALRSAGWHVAQCSSEGFPDLYVTREGSPRRVWLEVKKRTGRIQRAQRDLWVEWERAGILVYVAETPGDALNAVSDVGPFRTWYGYPVDERGRGAKRAKPKRWIPERLRKPVKARPGT